MGYLSEVTRRRIALVLLVVGGVVAALAVADVGPFSNPPTQAERAQGTVERFFSAGRAKDFKAACAQLTIQARRAMEQRAGAAAGQKGLKGCDQILALFLSKIRLSKVDQVRVSGNKAVVEAELAVSGASGSQSRTIDLFEIGGNWRISDFGT